MRSVLRAFRRNLRFLVSVLAVLGLAAAAAVASVPAASAAPGRPSHPAAAAAGPAVKPDNQVKVPGAMADLAAARRGGQRVAVAADQTAFSQTFANPDGSFTTSVSQQPRWARRGSTWVTASAALARNADGTLSPQAADAPLTLSGGGSKTLATISSGSQSMSLSWPSALPAPAVSGARATYAGVFPGVDLVVTAQAGGGFSQVLVVHDAAAAADPQLQHLVLGVALSSGLTQKAGKDGAVTVVDAAGKPVFSSPAPFAWDSAGPAASAAASTLGGPGPRAHAAGVSAVYGAGSVTLGVPVSLLSGASTVYPVYVDPSYTQAQLYTVYGELQSSRPTTVEVNSTYDGDVSAGYDGGGTNRGDYEFGLSPLPVYPSQLPVTVSSATLTATAVVTQTSATVTHAVDAYYTSEYDASTSPTWDNQPTALAGPVKATFTTASTTPDVPVSWSVASWVQTALNGSAWQLSAGLENEDENQNPADIAQSVEFSPNATLTYTYTQPAPSIPVGSGPVPGSTQLAFPVSDKVALHVNAGSGNALITTSDIALPEAAGPLTLGVAYNSLLNGTQVAPGSDGDGWTQREGPDVRLYLGSDGSLTYTGEDGTAGKFTPSGSSFTSPPQFHVTLASSSGSTCGGTGYTMTWHATGEVMCFNANGLLTSQADRNGNTTAYAYNGDGNQVTQIAYTPRGATAPAETVTAAYASPGYLNTLSESGGSLGTRTATYTLNTSTGNLTSVQQPDGTLVQFGYDSSNDVTSIKNGAGVTTTLTYDSSHRVTSVTQPYGSGTATATTRFSYVSATETQVAAPDTSQSQAVSAVPNTTYTLNSQDLVTATKDPGGNSTSTAYNSVNNVTSAQNQLGGTTASTYGSNSGESLTKTASPTGASTSAAFTNTATGADPTAQYLPSSSGDAQGNQTLYTYDGAGNLSQSADALPATAKVTPNSDGTPATSTDPTGGVTSYTYNTLHQLTKVTPPTSGTLTAVSLTYDGFGRVATVTDGNGNTLTYTYDLADRVTKEAFTGGAKTLTVSYAYDGAGNLKTQTSPSATTTWTYDGRNQVLTDSATSGGGTLSYSYDADGNMLTAKDAAGTATYTYNTLDQLASLTDPTGVLWQFAYNAAGERTATYYATNAGNTTYAVRNQLAYDTAGRITSIQAAGNSGAATLASNSYCYSPYVSGKACPTASATTDTELLQYSVNNQTSAVTQYAYDSGNRLKTATPSSGTAYSYGYDNDGNITTGAAAGALTYNTSNQITADGATYDHDGNMNYDPGNGTLAYTDASQLASASAASNGGGAAAAETFTYAGAGQNQPLTDGSATAITYGQSDQYGQPRVDSYATAGATDYVIRDQQGDPLGLISAGHSYIYLTDNSGSVTGISGSCGCSDASYAYTPYGALVSKSAGSGGSLVTSNLIGYTGALTDTYTAGSTGYIHDGARWYNPLTGAFSSQDTSSYLDNPANGNRYAYAADNPLNNTDPTGHDLCAYRPAECGIPWDTAGYTDSNCDTLTDVGTIFAGLGLFDAEGLALPALKSAASVGVVGGGGVTIFGCIL